MLTKQQVSDYLARIQYEGSLDATLETLTALQKAHLCSVPYETLAIFRKEPVSLQASDIFSKVVLHSRGGYCFELNELYIQLLLSLGFCVTRHFSRFLKGETGIPKPRHLLPIVHLPEGDYLSDVGTAAASPMSPLLLCHRIQHLPLNSWIIRELPDFGMTLCQWTKENEIPFCTIPSDPSFPQDIEPTHFYLTHHPDSPFLKKPILGLRTPRGAYVVRNDVFTIIDNDEVTKEVIKSEQRFTEICHTYFHIFECHI